jgi:hypothetical protein
VKRPERVRGRGGAVIVVDERRAQVITDRINTIGADRRVPEPPSFWDRFDALSERVLRFSVTKALWAIIALCGALLVVVVLAQVFGWDR